MWELYETECHKQHINLSNQAHDVIFLDMLNFMEEKNVSGFVNRIIENFSDDAEASYTEAMNRKRLEIEEALSEISKGPIKESIIDKLVDDYRRKIDLKVAGYPQGESISIRLSNGNYEHFFINENPTGEFYSRQGQFFKALLEEYAKLPQDKRESVFFKDTVDGIESAIIKKSMIKYSLKNGAVFEMKPIKTSPDPQTGWNYLLGYSRPYQSDVEWRLVSVRISRITRLGEIKSRSGKVTKEEYRSAMKRLSSSSIAYVQDKVEELTIRLTDRGMDILKMTLHLRPYFEKASDPNVITVKCTQRQAGDYFSKFGGEAEVISPQSFKEYLAGR